MSTRCSRYGKLHFDERISLVPCYRDNLLCSRRNPDSWLPFTFPIQPFMTLQYHEQTVHVNPCTPDLSRPRTRTQYLCRKRSAPWECHFYNIFFTTVSLTEDKQLQQTYYYATEGRSADTRWSLSSRCVIQPSSCRDYWVSISHPVDTKVAKCRLEKLRICVKTLYV